MSSPAPDIYMYDHSEVIIAPHWIESAISTCDLQTPDIPKTLLEALQVKYFLYLKGICFFLFMVWHLHWCGLNEWRQCHPMVPGIIVFFPNHTLQFLKIPLTNQWKWKSQPGSTHLFNVLCEENGKCTESPSGAHLNIMVVSWTIIGQDSNGCLSCQLNYPLFQRIPFLLGSSFKSWVNFG